MSTHLKGDVEIRFDSTQLSKDREEANDNSHRVPQCGTMNELPDHLNSTQLHANKQPANADRTYPDPQIHRFFHPKVLAHPSISK